MSARRRERVSLNPVTSRLCEVAAVGKDTSRIGYIKLTTFNQNASSEYWLFVNWFVLVH